VRIETKKFKEGTNEPLSVGMKVDDEYDIMCPICGYELEIIKDKLVCRTCNKIWL